MLKQRPDFYKQVVTLCLLLTGVLVGCRLQKDGLLDEDSVFLSVDALSGENAFAMTEKIVAITPRHSGTEGARQTAYLIKDLVEPYVDHVEIDAFDDPTPNGMMRFRNVIATRHGTGAEKVILASHFDTMSGISDTFQGANDSGSSTGLLLELARAIHQQPRLPFTVVFAFFDGEECIVAYGPNDGLHGSKHYAKRLEDEGRLTSVRAMIVLDMVGDRDLTITIPRNTSHELSAMAFEAARDEGVREKFRFFQGAIIDDHVPFYERGVPSLNLIDFEYGSAPGLNDYWHTEEDTLDKLSAESLETVGRVTLRILNRLAERPSAP